MGEREDEDDQVSWGYEFCGFGGGKADWVVGFW